MGDGGVRGLGSCGDCGGFESERLNKAADVRERGRRAGGDMTEGVFCGYLCSVVT